MVYTFWSQWTIAAHRSRIRESPQPKAPNSRRIQLLQKPVQASTCLRKSLPKEEWLRNTTTPSSSLSLTRVLIIYQLISTQDNSMGGRYYWYHPFTEEKRALRFSDVTWLLDHTLKGTEGPDPGPSHLDPHPMFFNCLVTFLSFFLFLPPHLLHCLPFLLILLAEFLLISFIMKTGTANICWVLCSEQCVLVTLHDLFFYCYYLQYVVGKRHWEEKVKLGRQVVRCRVWDLNPAVWRQDWHSLLPCFLF